MRIGRRDERVPARLVAVGTAVERTIVTAADRTAAARAARRAVAQLDVDAAVTLSLLHRSGAPPVAVTGTEQRVLPYALSIAHRDGHAIAAAARSRARVGVDVERAGSVEAGSVRIFATAAERQAGVDPTTLWILKEAAWKALACPPSLPFHVLELELQDGALCGIRLHAERLRAHAHVWAPWHGWLAALVVVPAAEGG